MTASKTWALIVGILIVGGALIGAVIWRQQHPESDELGRVASLVEPKPAVETPPAPKASAPSAAKPAEPSSPPVAALEPTPPAPPKPEPAAGHGEPPHFDVVRVEPTGEAVLAGKGDPNAEVALVEGGKVVAETKADPTGNFVILPPVLKPGAHDLTLRQSEAGQPAVESKQAVAVSVPKAGGQVVVALAEPGKPTRLISGPPQVPATPAPTVAAAPVPAKAPEAAAAKVARAEPETAIAPPRAIAPNGPGLAIRSAELENGNGFYATGVAAPGTHVQVYLNGSHLAEVTAGADGQWSVTIKKGLTAGHYEVRADALGSAGKVAARAEVPFDVPVAMAAAAAPPKPAETPALPAAPAVPAPTKSARADLGPEPPSAPNPSEVEGLGVEPDKPVASNAAPEPPSAPDPSDIAGLGPETPYAPPSDTVSEVPTPRPDIAAAAKVAAAAAPTNAAPILALAPPVAPDAKPQGAPSAVTIAPAAPVKAPPTLTAEKPSLATPTTTTGAQAVTAETAAAAAPSTGKSANAANAVIDEVETALVVPGDNLWNISRTRLGKGHRYTEVYAANVSQIRDPKLIYPGQVFVVPAK